MTPRETIAAMALQGILSSGHIDTLENMANDAVIAADLLLDALDDSDRSHEPESLAATMSIGLFDKASS